MSKLGLEERTVLQVNKSADWIMKHPYRNTIAIATTAFMSMFGIASFPTQPIEEAHKQLVAAARAYEAAKPVAGDTIEAVQQRMAAMPFKVTHRNGASIDCVNTLRLPANPIFKGNELAQPVDPKPYFDCLDTYKPIMPSSTPAEAFRFITFVIAPLGGLCIGGALALIATSGRRHSSAAQAKPAA